MLPHHEIIEKGVDRWFLKAIQSCLLLHFKVKVSHFPRNEVLPLLATPHPFGAPGRDSTPHLSIVCLHGVEDFLGLHDFTIPSHLRLKILKFHERSQMIQKILKHLRQLTSALCNSFFPSSTSRLMHVQCLWRERRPVIGVDHHWCLAIKCTWLSSEGTPILEGSRKCSPVILRDLIQIPDIPPCSNRAAPRTWSPPPAFFSPPTCRIVPLERMPRHGTSWETSRISYQPVSHSPITYLHLEEWSQCAHGETGNFQGKVPQSAQSWANLKLEFSLWSSGLMAIPKEAVTWGPELRWINCCPGRVDDNTAKLGDLEVLGFSPTTTTTTTNNHNQQQQNKTTILKNNNTTTPTTKWHNKQPPKIKDCWIFEISFNLFAVIDLATQGGIGSHRKTSLQNHGIIGMSIH